MIIKKTTDSKFKSYEGRTFSNNKKHGGKFSDEFKQELKNSIQSIDNIRALTENDKYTIHFNAAVDYLGLHKVTVRNMLKNSIRSRKIDGKLMLHMDDVKEIKQRQEIRLREGPPKWPGSK